MTFENNAFPVGPAADGAPSSSSANTAAAVCGAQEVLALNELVVAILDNADEYRRAIGAVAQLLNSLQHELHNREQAAEHVQCQVRALGAQPPTNPSSLATAFAARLTTRQPVAKDRYEDFLHDVMRGKDALSARFRQQLNDAELSASNHECVSHAFDQITADHTDAVDKRNAPNIATPLSVLTSIVYLHAYSIARHGEESSPTRRDRLRPAHTSSMPHHSQ